MRKLVSHEPALKSYIHMGLAHQISSSLEVDAWKRSLNLDPKRADAHVNIGNCYALILKNYADAIHHLEVATQLDPTDGEMSVT